MLGGKRKHSFLIDRSDRGATTITEVLLNVLHRSLLSNLFEYLSEVVHLCFPFFKALNLALLMFLDNLHVLIKVFHHFVG